MKRFVPAFVAALSLLTASCSSLSVSSEADPDADLASLKTYAWAVPRESSSQTGTTENASILDKKIRSMVEQQLAGVGLRPAAPGEAPDFQVMYFADAENRVTTTNGGVGVGVGGPVGWVSYDVPTTYQYREGRLTLNFVDPETRSELWRGYAEAEIDEPGKNDATIKEAITQMVRRFDEVRDKQTQGAS